MISHILIILFLHWVFDFVAQSHEDAIGKSKSLSRLLSHTSQYSAWWIFPSFIFGIISNNPLLFLFPIITFICHTITDYYTSRDNARLYAKGNMHDFFVGVGFDQYLHQLQLILTYCLLW